MAPKSSVAETVAAQKISTGKLGREAESKLEEITKTGGTAMDKARALKAYVRQTLTYSNDSSMNAENVVNAPQNPAIQRSFMSGPKANFSSLNTDKKPISKHPNKLTTSVP